MTSKKMIIQGITLEGKKFRPNDWAERISGTLSVFKKNRIIYSPLLLPSQHNGSRSITVDLTLKEKNPQLFQHIVNFAQVNGLKVFYEDGP